MHPSPGDSSGEEPRRHSTSSVGLASIVAAASGYLVMTAAARTLPVELNAEFLAFWSALFVVFGILSGVQNESTRASGSAMQHQQDQGPPRGARIAPIGLGLGAALALVVAVTSPWWSVHVAGSGQPWLVVVICGSIVAFAGHCAVAGVLSGRHQWRDFSMLVGSEAVTRLLLTAGALVLGMGLGGLEAAAAAAAATWLVVVALSPAARSALTARADLPTRRLVTTMLKSTGAAAATAVLLVGYPAAVRLTSSPDEFARAAPLLLAISLTRAPLMIPLSAYQGVAITHFLKHRNAPGRSLVRISGLILGATVIGATAAALVGPWLMSTLFGPSYRVDGLLLALLTLGAGSLAALTVTASATLAVGSHTPYLGGWLVASVISVAALLLPTDLAGRVVIGLVAGPLAGTVIHVLALVRHSTTRSLHFQNSVTR